MQLLLLPFVIWFGVLYWQNIITIVLLSIGFVTLSTLLHFLFRGRK